MSRTAERHASNARVAIERGDLDAAIAELPAAWRACRHPRIADLIDRVGAEVDLARGPVPGDTQKARCAAWHVIEEDRDPGDVGRLLAVLWPANGKLGWELYRKLVKWPDDPRLPAKVLELPRRGYADRAGLWKQICTRIVKLDDARVLPTLSKRALPKEIRNQLTALRDREPPVISPALDEALTAIERRYATDIQREQAQGRGEPEMLAAIFASPQDLSLRDVYADWLIQHGDPRGEMIALQRARAAGRGTPKSAARERALLDEHGGQWAEPLTKLIKDWAFEDGFVASGRLTKITGWQAPEKGKARRVDPKTQLPHWQLVRRLDVIEYEDVSRLLADLPNLEGLYAMSTAALGLLARGPVRRLKELGCFGDSTSLDATSALPSLRALTLQTVSPMVARLPRSKLGAQLERVTLVGFVPEPSVVERLLALPRLTELTMHGYDRGFYHPDPTLRPHGYELRISRDRRVRGAFHRSSSPIPTDHSSLVARYLAALPSDITSLELEPSRSLKLDDQRDTIAHQMRRFTKLELR